MHTINSVEKRMIMVNLQIVFSIGVVLVSVGRRILGGLSITDVEDFSIGCKAVYWIDCFHHSFFQKETFLHAKKMPAMQASELVFVFIRSDVLKEILTKHLSLG